MDEWIDVALIATTSQGGPYDDDAFAAGITFGHISRDLDDDRPISIGLHEYDVPAALIPQLDLLAMVHGYRLEHTAYGDRATVTFTKIGPG